MSKRKGRPTTTLGRMALEAQAEAEARRIARDSGVSEGLWELFLADAYRRITGLDGLDKRDAASNEPKESQ